MAKKASGSAEKKGADKAEKKGKAKAKADDSDVEDKGSKVTLAVVSLSVNQHWTLSRARAH
jgi:hypothetical protein